MIRILLLVFCMMCFSCSGIKNTLKPSKISVLIDGRFDDKSFNESAWTGVKELEKDFGIEVVGKKSTLDSYINDIKELKDDGTNLIWLIGYRFSNVAINAASDTPGLKYAIVDPIYESGIIIPANLATITFRTEEGAFLVGYIAAKTSKTGKIGFMGGIKSGIVDSFRFGYEAGAKYANQNINIHSDYLGTFDDAEAGRNMAKQMYADGIDIIYHAAGLGGIAAIEVATELGEGHYIIGIDQDQSYLAPDNILTSSIKDIKSIVYNISDNYLNKNIFEGGKILSYGLKEGFVSFVKNPKMIPLALEKELDEMSEKIINEEVIVPYDEETYAQFTYEHF
ncbi:BMP family ABC transporter substrate-binding protein (plasmid) [Borrelia turcica IST7]|uniref:BMP family ABC transporter substrate-binding protein n=1 Tax=Borrelia turcica IST7 TaxID=1104446 RepID=A0A386PPC1_9SPIR|nr:BMP family protein [Borrelia turcica]AYE36895.1 BMP family ABC transporter substrate-binding protein [Borrelia turcica IST7]